jgi:hypothetical protein
MEEKCIKVFVRKPEGKNPLAKPRHRWENNINTNLKKGHYRV